MKHLTIILSIAVAFVITQTQAQENKITFSNFLKEADMQFKMPQNFQDTSLKEKEIVLHPRYIAGTILKLISNPQQDVMVALSVVPYTFNGEEWLNEKERTKCLLPLEYDITKGSVNTIATQQYKADTGQSYPVRVFKEYLNTPLKKYTLCHKIDFVNYKKGRAVAYFFYNQDNEYIKNLIMHFYEYFRFEQ